MRTQNTQGSFITLLQTFLAKAKEANDVAASAADTESIPVHPLSDMVADLRVLRALSMTIQQRPAIEDGPGNRVFRYSTASSSLREVPK